MRLRSEVRRDIAAVDELFALVGDSRRMMLIALLQGQGVEHAAKLLRMRSSSAAVLARQFIKEGLAKTTFPRRVVLTALGKRAALAAFSPVKSAIMVGTSEEQADLF